MRSSMMKISFSILIIVLYYQTIASEGATDNTLVTETCNKAAQSNPTLNYDFCVKSLHASPKSAIADLRWLGIIITSLAKAKAAYGQIKIDALLAKQQNPYDIARRFAVTCEDSWKEDAGHASLLSSENFNLEQLCRIGLAITNFLPSTS
ncbi:putative invertase inhibitor [Aristolochia californica]|uniref:putative invertase inhibitor n=1 Tax=Aristolochia californica TaxID=171875 RepID=UPI0035DBD062